MAVAIDKALVYERYVGMHDGVSNVFIAEDIWDAMDLPSNDYVRHSDLTAAVGLS